MELKRIFPYLHVYHGKEHFARTKSSPPKSIIVKQHGNIPHRLKLKWGNVWDRMRNKKEGAFISSIWHKVVTINAWRARLITRINDKCCMCSANIPKTIA